MIIDLYVYKILPTIYFIRVGTRYPRFFLKKLHSTTQTLTTRTHTHPYEYTYANPIPMSSQHARTLNPMNTRTQTLSLWAPAKDWAPTNLEIPEVTNGASLSTGTSLQLTASNGLLTAKSLPWSSSRRHRAHGRVLPEQRSMTWAEARAHGNGVPWVSLDSRQRGFQKNKKPKN
jgi:hypothetical protein